jgi:lipoprotein-releasing system ATP-binding protein
VKLVLRANNIKKGFADVDKGLVLNSIDLSVKPRESIAIVGKSGSGKSTFLQICGLLDTPSSGNITVDGVDCAKLSDDEKTLIRRNKIGFVYQFHHLLSEFSVMENLVIPQLICGIDEENARQKAKDFLEKFTLINKKDSFIHQLSGGERQRVAIIRSIINDPKLILADEPTGNLDNANAQVAFDLLQNVLLHSNAAMVIATHSMEIAKMCSRVMSLENGVLNEIEIKK